VVALRSPRLESIFGAPLDALTSQHIHGLVTSSAQEAFDLDFKKTLYGRTDPDKWALAGDVAAMANTGGGVIVLGVEEDDRACATAIPGVVRLYGRRRRSPRPAGSLSHGSSRRERW
jgi:Putative DNA-binding domain